MNKSLIYTGTLTPYHKWATDLLKEIGVYYLAVSNHPNYQGLIQQSGFCLSIMPDTKHPYPIVQAKIFDYLKYKKPIIHMTKHYDETSIIIKDLDAGMSYIQGTSNPQDILDFMNGEHKYSYDGRFSADRAVEQLEKIIFKTLWTAGTNL